MQNLGDGGQIRCIMGNVEVTNARDSALAVMWYYQSYESEGGGGEGEGGRGAVKWYDSHKSCKCISLVILYICT